jgi:hypothetical protein
MLNNLCYYITYFIKRDMIKKYYGYIILWVYHIMGISYYNLIS